MDSTPSSAMENNENLRLSSRARPRKPHEPDPFLSLDIIHSPLEKQGEVVRLKKPQGSMVDRLSIGNASNRSTPRASAVPLESSRKVQEFVKPSVYAKGSNFHVKKPFKHAIDNSQIVSKDQVGHVFDPALQMADTSAMATYHVQQVIGRPRSAGKGKQSGRLQKGRLREQNPVSVSGPTISQCRGVVADRRLAQTSQKVERRGYLVASLQHNPGLLGAGDGVSSIDALDRTESLHQPSEASSEAGEETDRLRQLADELGQSEITTGLAGDERYEAKPTSAQTVDLLRLLTSRDLLLPDRPFTQPTSDQMLPSRRQRPATVGERPKSVRFAAELERQHPESCREAAGEDGDQNRGPDEDDPGPGDSHGNSPYVRSTGTISSLSSNFSPETKEGKTDGGGGGGGGSGAKDVEIVDPWEGTADVSHFKGQRGAVKEAWTISSRPCHGRQRRCKSAGSSQRFQPKRLVLFDRNECPLFCDEPRVDEDDGDEVCLNFDDLDRQLETVLNQISEEGGVTEARGYLSELLCDSDIAENRKAALQKMAEEMKRLLSDVQSKRRQHVRVRSAPPQTNNFKRALDISGKTVTLHHRNSAYDVPAKFPPMCFRINTSPPVGKVFYFAYGLDINPTRTTTRLSSIIRTTAPERHWGVLFGFRLRFNRKGKGKGGLLFANVEYDSNSSVEGAIYTLDVHDLPLLSKSYDCPKSNSRIMLPIWTSKGAIDDEENAIAGQCVPGLLFAANTECTVNENDVFNPSCEYSIKQCLLGGDDLFSDNYQMMLKSRLR